MTEPWLDTALNFGIPAVLIVLAYVTGSLIERRHFRRKGLSLLLRWPKILMTSAWRHDRNKI